MRHQQNRWLVAALVFWAAAGLIATAAWAESVHFKHNVTLADQGFVVQFEGSLAGLGNGDVVIHLTAQADAETLCTNRGGNKAVGQNPADVTTAGTQIIPASEIQNGTVFVSLTTLVPPPPTVAAAGCPNGNWKASFSELNFHSATVVVSQNGVVVLTETFEI